jgi:signal transduction histidine kinase
MHFPATKARVELSTTPKAVVAEIRDNGRGGANLSAGRRASRGGLDARVWR